MKKNTKIFIFVIAIVVVISIFAWDNLHRKNIDNLPSLEQVSNMEDEAELNSYITDFTKQELTAAWGEPTESSSMEDVWYINENTKLVVNYHNNTMGGSDGEICRATGAYSGKSQSVGGAYRSI